MSRGSITSPAGWWLIVGLLVGGCSADQPLPKLDVEGASPTTETRAGTLVAEYVAPRGHTSSAPAPSRGGGVSINAQFLDVRGVNYHTALQALQVWSPDRQLDVDACSLRTGAPAQQPPPRDIRLELLDMGPISVHGPSEALRLEARRLPDLLSAFSGVIYGTEQSFDSQPINIGYQPGGWYSFAAPGLAGHSGFGVSIRAPRPIRIVAVNGRAAAGGAPFSVPFNDDMTIGWQPVGGGSSPDAVFLRISSGFGPDRPELTCHLEDDGAFAMPATIIDQLDPTADELEVSLRRINAQDVDIAGLERSEFIFSTVDDITVVRRE